MSMRVLAGPEAVEAAERMRATVEGGLDAELAALDAAAQRLSDPNVWDGPHAVQFRSVWSEMAPRLRQTHTDLVQLRSWVHAVAGSILAAGGS